MVKILLAEDDMVLGDGIQTALQHSGYKIEWVTRGDDADHLLSINQYDLVILDLGLPGLDGLDVLRNARQRRMTSPIIVLTARESLEDRVRGLDFGADDYLIKPFDLPELEARLRALVRRGYNGNQSGIMLGSLYFDLAGRRVYVSEQPVSLSSREMTLLETLLLRTGHVVSKESLLENLYGFDEEVGENAIEVYIHRLRKKLEHGGLNIRTIRGLGYMVERIETERSDIERAGEKLNGA